MSAGSPESNTSDLEPLQLESRIAALVGSLLALCLAALPSSAGAQLTDATQTFPVVPGGQIAKSLEEQVGAGQGDVFTERSSVYLIKRDPARSVRRGRQLFQRKFTREQGLGPRVDATSSGDIAAVRELGAGLADSCAACHGRPRGSAGHGGDVVTRPDSRDSPHLFGLGLVEQLADEITRDLRAIRDLTLEQASASGATATNALTSKGVSYGVIAAAPDGTLDTSGVEGVDADLRVRPFFHHGGTISIREFVIGALKAEMGLTTNDPTLCALTEPGAIESVTSPSGFVFDPAEDTFERPPVCPGGDPDPDGDGVVDEIDPAVVDHLEFYLLNYFKPGRGRETARSRQGLALMEKIGCTECHVQNLTLERDRRVADVETVHDPVNGIFNRLFASAAVRVEMLADGHIDAVDGLEHPQLLPAGEPFVVENIFADFKRHDLGPGFHEREYDDVDTAGASRVTEFMTEPLWGVATTAPYGHDGRSMNLEEVILRHGGEAQASRDAFARLPDNQKSKLFEFLGTLVLFPPDDTASNLNPGNPDTDDPQTPSEHGSINLGALFQIEYEGPE
jgi:hypothetical protein